MKPLLIGLLIHSALLCFLHYATFRALWLDEAFVAQSLLKRTLPGLFSVLEYNQQFPRLYLSAIFLLKTVVGYKIWVLRLFPFLFSLGSIAVWTALYHGLYKKKYAGGFLVLSSVVLFLTNHFIYYFAGDLKPYTADIFWAGFALYFGQTRMMKHLEAGLGHWILLCGLWAAPCLLSLTYSFVLPAVMLGLLGQRFFQRGRRDLMKMGALFAAAALFIWAAYLVDIHYGQDAGLQSYWADRFVKGDTLFHWSASLWAGVNRILGRWWTEPTTIFLTLLGLGGVVNTAWDLKKGRASGPSLAGLVVFLELIVLAILHKYPLEYGRTNLFFFPFAVILITDGFRFFLRSTRAQLRLAGYICMGLVLLIGFGWKVPTISKAYYRFHHWEDINPAMRALDPAQTRFVVYGPASEAQVEVYPNRPEQFTFLTSQSLSRVSPKKRKELLGSSFYFIYANPNGDLEDFQAVLKNQYAARKLEQHLYLFSVTKSIDTGTKGDST